MNKYTFTIFTPTYNRADLIHRVFDSLSNQNFTDFEWLVVDDGSIDNTDDVIEGFKQIADFKIRYYKTENSGKASAINEALDYADGFFFLVLDSDDWCDFDALSVLWRTWSTLEPAEKENYSGISCLKRYSEGNIVGESYSRMSFRGESYVSRFNKRIKGDKWELIKTNLYRDNKYKLFKNEKYMAPEYSWVHIGMNYKTIFLNRSLSIIEYQEGGISKNNIKHRVSSPNNTCEVYRYYTMISTSMYMRLRCLVNYNRFALHAGRLGWVHPLRIITFPLSYALYLYDKTQDV